MPRRNAITRTVASYILSLFLTFSTTFLRTQYKNIICGPPNKNASYQELKRLPLNVRHTSALECTFMKISSDVQDKCPFQETKKNYLQVYCYSVLPVHFCYFVKEWVFAFLLLFNSNATGKGALIVAQEELLESDEEEETRLLIDAISLKNMPDLGQYEFESFSGYPKCFLEPLVGII